MAEMSVRQWQERFRAGDFNSRDLSVQCEAGWYDWFCRDDALAGRLKKLSSVVLGIRAPFILDNYYVWFKNNCPMAGPLYDDVRFEPLSGERDGKYFVVSLDSPHEQTKWVLYTERYGYDAWDGEHKFSYISRKDRQLRKVTVTWSLEYLPAGYTAEQAEQHGTLYVFGTEQPIPVELPGKEESVQKKERER